MKSVNKVFLLGYVGKDPVIRTTTSGTVIANFSLATTERRKNQQGEWQDDAEWHNLVAFGSAAEIVRDYVKKGAHLHIEGRLRTRSWDDSGTKRYATEIVIDELTMLGGTKDKPAAKQTETEAYAGQF